MRRVPAKIKLKFSEKKQSRKKTGKRHGSTLRSPVAFNVKFVRTKRNFRRKTFCERSKIVLNTSFKNLAQRC